MQISKYPVFFSITFYYFSYHQYCYRFLHNVTNISIEIKTFNDGEPASLFIIDYENTSYDELQQIKHTIYTIKESIIDS